MDAKSLIAAHQFHADWYGDDPKNDLKVAYGMLMLSVQPVVPPPALQERQARLNQIIQRQTEHLRQVEARLVAAGMDRAAMKEWSVLLTETASCAALEKLLDALVILETLPVDFRSS